jgi:epoxyqueuosine reductase
METKIIKYAESLNFDLVGITDINIDTDVKLRFTKLTESELYQDFSYLRNKKRLDPQLFLNNAKSIIMLGINYLPYIFEKQSRKNGYGRIGLFALGTDYHIVIKERLDKLCLFIKDIYKQDVSVKSFVDSSAVLEKYFASRTHLGFIGKNTLLISKEFGSWIFLCGIILDKNLNVEAPIKSWPPQNHCRDCELCTQICPTGALKPYILDTRKCIAHLTLKKNAAISEDLSQKFGDWIFGCDMCQLVCPYNQKTQSTKIIEFKSRYDKNLIEFDKIFKIKNNDEFKNFFKNSQISMLSKDDLIRNMIFAS